jgi:hypothetical protein
MVVRTVDLLHAISILVVRASQPCWLASGRFNLNCDSCPMDECIWTGIHVVRTVESIFPYLNLERKSEAGRTLRVVRTGCLNVRTDVSWNRSFSIQRKVQMGIHAVWTDDALVWWASGRYDTSSGRLELWTARRPDGMTRRPGGWQGTKFFNLQTMQNLLKHFWIAESLLKSIFTYKWFCPIRM